MHNKGNNNSMYTGTESGLPLYKMFSGQQKPSKLGDLSGLFPISWSSKYYKSGNLQANATRNSSAIQTCSKWQSSFLFIQFVSTWTDINAHL